MSSAYCVGVRIDTAMSLVTWSPAIGITAVWRIAPLANTARSVVPPPMSTRHTPSSFSSSVSTAKLEASCSSTTSSTSRPQRWMHFSMFCAALIGAGDDVHLGLQAHARHADRVADALLAVDDEFLRQHVQDLLVGGDRHRLGGVDDVLDVAVAHLLVADRRPRRAS